MKRLSKLQNQISYRLSRSKATVFLREDFKDLADYNQIGRALRNLVAKGELVKIGYGLYARSVVSPLSGRVVPRRGLPDLAIEALERLNIEVQPSSFDHAYNADKSTQVPTGRVIAVKGRISRKIGYDGKYVSFEQVPKPRPEPVS